MAYATTQEQETSMLKSRINELQSALFFTESKSIVKLPTHVISEVEMDGDGQLWFVIPKPAMHIEAYDREIPAKLDFFKKGKDFFVKIKGVAFLQVDATEANAGLSAGMRQRMSDEELIAVKVKIDDADMVDNSPKTTQSWLQMSRTQLSSWFF